MDGLAGLVALFIFLYCIGALSKKNEQRMEKFAQKFMDLFRSNDGKDPN
ncbi:MAG: hypothetical protein GY863_19900 [bacterium]|nr:hypothetical protein [bacterium]